MDDLKQTKSKIRKDMITILESLSENEIALKTRKIENRLFDFANFVEANITMLYISCPGEVSSRNIITYCLDHRKIIVLPAFDPQKFRIRLFKIDNIEKDLKPGSRGMLEPDTARCKSVPVECLDIAIIPGIAFDEKGGRIGSGEGYYDRFIPKLPITTRKVSIAFEDQIIPQAPMESHDKHVDIIITNERTIYKI
ncbi:MAG: 5-formyltetrahydrofolate cyclo-ligase [Deltaproteobacteria bacterium]|nr:5-formyltetrahydrofolate cyclo-ligase [Deltaproteobacteria bacterium]